MHCCNFFVLCVSMILLASSASAWKADLMGQCSQEDSNKMDLAFGDIFLWGQMEREMIKDLSTTSKWCGEATAGIKLVKDTSKQCLTGLPKQVLNLIMSGIEKGVEKNCKDESARRLAGSNLGCLNKVMPAMRNTMYNLTRDLRMVNSLPSDSKINGICCSFYKFQSKIAEIGSSKCGKNTVDHMDDFINDFGGEAHDLVCQSVGRTSDICEQLSLDSSEQQNDSQLQSITFVPSCIDALSRLGKGEFTFDN